MESKNSKTVIVTGGSSRGLGKSIIQLFSENYIVFTL